MNLHSSAHVQLTMSYQPTMHCKSLAAACGHELAGFRILDYISSLFMTARLFVVPGSRAWQASPNLSCVGQLDKLLSCLLCNRRRYKIRFITVCKGFARRYVPEEHHHRMTQKLSCAGFFWVLRVARMPTAAVHLNHACTALA